MDRHARSSPALTLSVLPTPEGLDGVHQICYNRRNEERDGDEGRPFTSWMRLSSSWSSPMDGYSLPSSSLCSSYILLLFCMSAMSTSSSSSVARRLPFDFVSTRLTRECVELKDCFGVPSDRDDPVGDGGEVTLLSTFQCGTP